MSGTIAAEQAWWALAAYITECPYCHGAEGRTRRTRIRITTPKRHTHPHLRKGKTKVRFTYCTRCLPAIRACEAICPGRERPIRTALEQGFTWPQYVRDAA